MRLQQLDTELRNRGLKLTFREKQSLLSQSGPISEVLERYLNPPQAPQLPELQDGGGKDNTLYVDPSDLAVRERYQAYQDSLKAYNTGLSFPNLWEKADLDYFNKKYANNKGEIKREALSRGATLVYPDQYNNKGEKVDPWNNTINGIKPYRIGRSTLYYNGQIVKDAVVEYPIYKKPVQPVVFKPGPYQIPIKTPNSQPQQIGKIPLKTIPVENAYKRPIDFRIFDAAPNLEKEGRPIGYQNFGDGRGRIPIYQRGGQYDPTPASSTRVSMPPMLPLGQMVQDNERVRRIEENQRLASQLPNELKYQGPVPDNGKIDYRYTDRRSSNFSGTPNMAFVRAGKTGTTGKLAEDDFNVETLGALTPFAGRGYRGAQAIAKGMTPAIKKAIAPTLLKAVTKAENLTEAALGTRDVAQEIAGEIVMGKQNRAAIKEGNDWLKAWIDHPDTQWKIHNDMEKARQADREFFRGIEGVDGPSNIIERDARLYTPDVKEYDLGSQIAENAAQYLYPYTRKPIHAGNLGVSYTHNTPYYKRDMMKKTQLPNQDPRYGDWMSRKRNISPERRTSVVIHEGTHGWVGKDALEASGQEKMALDMLSPRVRTAIETVNDLRAIGKDPEKILGEADTYKAYLGEPTEVHARIMQLRHHLGLKPSDVADPEYASDVMRYIKALPKDKSPIDSKFFSVIDNDPERLSDLFNKLWGTAPTAISTAAGLEAYRRTMDREE